MRMKKKMTNKLDFKLTGLTIALWVICLSAFSIVHEYGHAFACWTQGNSFDVHISLLANYTSCIGHLDYKGAYLLAGGFTASGLAFILFASVKNFITQKTRFIAIVLVVIGITQFANMIAETWFNDFYMKGSAMTVIDTLLAMVFLFYLIQRHSPKQIQMPKPKEIPENIFKRSIVDIIKGRKPTPKRHSDLTFSTQPTATLDVLSQKKVVEEND